MQYVSNCCASVALVFCGKLDTDLMCFHSSQLSISIVVKVNGFLLFKPMSVRYIQSSSGMSGNKLEVVVGFHEVCPVSSHHNADGRVCKKTLQCDI